MKKDYIALGLMSGTSGDGIDASIIKSDGKGKYEVILNKYVKYNDRLFREIHSLKDVVNAKKDLIKYSKKINDLERKITLFHAEVVNEILKKNSIDLIGFHGQTIYHNPSEKISKQLGNATLLSQLCNTSVVYNFRENDIKNGGQGAPLASIFHQQIINQKKIKTPTSILNIGGIANITIIKNKKKLSVESSDIGPGNCLIDEGIRKNSKKKYDLGGEIANTGKINEIILEQVEEYFLNRFNIDKLSLDTKDFDISFARGLSIEDGAATLTELTSTIITNSLSFILRKYKNKKIKILVCGGGRKNNLLMRQLNNKISKNFTIEPIDKYNIDGDFIESQAFAYLSIRSILKIPISFPKTTGCIAPVSGGDVIEIK